MVHLALCIFRYKNMRGTLLPVMIVVGSCNWNLGHQWHQTPNVPGNIFLYTSSYFNRPHMYIFHYCDAIMGANASQITSLTVVYSTVYWRSDQRTHQSSPSLAFVRGIHRWPVNSPHKWPVTRKMFPFHDVIMSYDKFNRTNINGLLWKMSTPKIHQFIILRFLLLYFRQQLKPSKHFFQEWHRDILAAQKSSTLRWH